MMHKFGVLGPVTLALVAVAGLSACSSNPEKKEAAAAPAPQAPAPAPVAAPPAQAPAAPASAKVEAPAKGKKGSKAAKGAKATKQAAPAQTVEAAPAATPAPAPEQPAAPVSGKIGPGMNARGEVVDSSKVESGHGQKVKGIRDFEGEITGRPAPGTKFTRLQIGMPMKQVTDLIGQPSDQGAYITGKAFIPFYFGGDTHRQELVYKGQGRLIFAGGSIGDFTGANLIWIIHNANEPAYR
ncbi:hypothetical protein [Zoogloea sp.]|uniref:hypothetical protein n=1 Tax=Zoogloea sp. TaxID=49181 RepID=UPI0025F3B1AD|nr:hypothetical protein [Zoogloea sp.]MCK6394601.1 hypothetical protein [Zoogloea sp.]